MGSLIFDGLKQVFDREKRVWGEKGLFLFVLCSFLCRKIGAFGAIGASICCFEVIFQRHLVQGFFRFALLCSHCMRPVS